MGYRGKLREQDEARRLRARAWTLAEIAEHLQVSKSSVSLWVRDVAFAQRPRSGGGRAARRGPNRLERRKHEEIERLLAEGRARIGRLSERDFLIAGVALYAGEGMKRDGQVGFANTSPAFVDFFCRWLRHFFDVDESRLRLRLYLHEGLDIEAANCFWQELTGIPQEQFLKPYRAAADATLRHAKHTLGCPAVTYGCSRTHRTIMGLVQGLMAAGGPAWGHQGDT
jgi:hypothetical protein